MSNESIIALANRVFDGARRRSVLIVGDHLLDIYVGGSIDRLNPEGPAHLVRVRRKTYNTGGAGNVAKNCARFGAKTTLVGVVGADEGADRLKEAATNEGYEAKVVTDSGRPTSTKTRVLQLPSHHLTRFDEESEDDISGSVERQVLDAIVTERNAADAIFVADYNKGVVTRRVAKAILQEGGRRMPIMADLKPARASFFAGVGMMAPNLGEARQYLGAKGKGLSPERLAKEISVRFRTTVYLTMASEGIYVQVKDGKGIHVPQRHKVAVADTSGCGDTAAAMILLATLCGASPEEAAMLANAAAAVVAQKVGAVAPSPDEIFRMLAS